MDASFIAKQRGFQLDYYPYSFDYILVKADIDEVSTTLARLKSVTIFKNFYSNFEACAAYDYLVWQYFGHDWTILEDKLCQAELSEQLSKILKTDSIYYSYEKTSGWQGYDFFRNGKKIESYSYGIDYYQEMPEVAEPTQEEKNYKSSYNSYDIKDEKRGYLFSFYSNIRTALDDEIKNEKPFLNNFFVSQNAWLPSYKYMPYIDENAKKKQVSQSYFTRVNFVKAYYLISTL